MYFKKAGHKIQVLAYRGYDKDKRRAIVKMVGSISGLSFSPSAAHGDSLTEDERKEIQAYIETVRQKEQESMQKWYAESLADKIGGAIEAIKAGQYEVTPEWAEAVWGGMDELGRLLRKAGYGKHKTLRKQNPGRSQKEIVWR